MKIVRSEAHRLHFPKGELYGGVLVRPFECPERWDYIMQRLSEQGLQQVVDPPPLDMTPVRKIHGEDFLSFLAEAWALWEAENYAGEAIPSVIPARRMRQKAPRHIDGKLGFYCMAIETAITSGTWEAAQSSAACALGAQRYIAAGEPHAFALCRPPGHHAGKDLYGGYCFLNNAAIAAQACLDSGAARVALLDVDFHHGNGSQDIFYERDDVYYLSLHGQPQDAFPHFLGYADESGAGPGEGFNRNYPLAPGTAYDVWGGQALEDACKRISRYAPDVLVVSLGVDTFEHDPISFFKLTSTDFSVYGERLAKLRVPTLFIMEGGYAVSEIGTNTVNVLTGFLQG